MKFTHKGWFGICPVYLADLEGESPVVDPRHWVFTPLMWLSERLLDLAFVLWFLLTFNEHCQWPLLVTGELPTAIER